MTSYVGTRMNVPPYPAFRAPPGTGKSGAFLAMYQYVRSGDFLHDLKALPQSGLLSGTLQALYAEVQLYLTRVHISASLLEFNGVMDLEVPEGLPTGLAFDDLDFPTSATMMGVLDCTPYQLMCGLTSCTRHELQSMSCTLSTQTRDLGSSAQLELGLLRVHTAVGCMVNGMYCTQRFYFGKSCRKKCGRRLPACAAGGHVGSRRVCAATAICSHPMAGAFQSQSVP